ncbi:MAG TPA: sugar phosphate nucleotidyltransferase [Planctomycetota bacterium]|jgi:mannose-1-phosphate guanylyltransferase|nr:sugar phosphate nucleotidyltransferase [Planctomycetota bacterium]
MTGLHAERLWAIVLAGGEGRRLSGLTYALHGREVPKQFAFLDGERSLLQRTLERIAGLVAPARTVVVVGAAHESTAREQIEAFPGVDLAVQPRNLDTAVGVLFPLARILARDAGASVAVFPSDHYIPRPEPFLAAVEEAARASVSGAARLTLLGVPSQAPETSYGWILPGARFEPRMHPRLRSVLGFVEKPGPDLARRLFDEGGLWNTLVSVGTVEAYGSLAGRCVPEIAEAFAVYATQVGGPREAECLRALYGRIPAANLSRDVLERASGLSVLPVEGSGWCDWGTPGRVLESLTGSPALSRLRERIGAGARPVRVPLVPTAGETRVERRDAAELLSAGDSRG